MSVASNFVRSFKKLVFRDVRNIAKRHLVGELPSLLHVQAIVCNILEL